MPARANFAVFLSYASQDTEAARRICEALQTAGIEVWFDQSELRGGDAWDQKIKKQIRECSLFIPLISANTNARAEGYFRLEWKLAVDRSHLMADDAPFLVPALLDEIPDAAARVPDRFREVQWTRLLTADAPAAFAARVKALLTGPTETTPAAPRTVAPTRPSTGGTKTTPTPAPAPAASPDPRFAWRPTAGQPVPDTKWTLERKLGEGGFGEVWLGRHRTMKERRVFKFCFEAERVRSLKRELTLFRVLKERIGGHPNIVRLLDVHFDEPPFYLEMDYIEGESLKTWCEQQGGVDKIPLATRLELVAQVADALHAAHTAGVIHRDVKPGNILIAHAAAPGAQPVAKLSDFGIGQVISDEALAGVTKSGFTKSMLAEASAANSGTQLYMAPELVAGAAASARTDLYSLGVVLFQLAVGDLRRPLTTEWARAVEDPALREDLERCFAERAEERFENASQLAVSLRAIEQRRAALLMQQAAATARARAARRWKLVLVSTAAVIMLGLGTSLALFLQRNAKSSRVRETLVPEIQRLIAAQDIGAAYALAVLAERDAPDEPALLKLWEKISIQTSIATSPAGATVSVREYQKPSAAWVTLGPTPLKDIRLPLVYTRWKFQKEGYAPLERAAAATAKIDYALDPSDTLPPDMVKISKGSSSRVVTGMPGVKLEDFLIDRYEVTNRQFKAFVDGGGYTNAAYWKQPMVKAGQTLSREDALAAFRDSTGRPGPATWKDGNYATAEADFPVTGVSWFEAAAYAEFAGKRLPSIYHWYLAAAVGNRASIASTASLSNFSGQGLAPVGRYQGMSPSGTYDMAGNAKEWCSNPAGDAARYILGGTWNEPDYSFVNLDVRSPFDRSPFQGFRCMKLPEATTLEAVVDASFVSTIRDYTHTKPVNDETFRVYLSLYSYDKPPLDARLEATDDSDPRWRRERVSFNAAYGGERMGAILFLPKNTAPPYQTIVFFPGSGAWRPPSSDNLANLESVVPYLVGGRALIYPIYRGSYERKPAEKSPSLNDSLGSSGYRDEVIVWSKDMRCAIDYLETRPDIQTDRLAYAGQSLGAALGVILPAVEPRIKVNVLTAGGFWEDQSLPEVDQINFGPRNTVPTLMLNGRYDFRFPLELSQRPMFQWLGAPAEHKRHVLSDLGHAPLPGLIASEANPWLDKYLGPVKR